MEKKKMLDEKEKGRREERESRVGEKSKSERAVG